jgi:hypothetical protein
LVVVVITVEVVLVVVRQEVDLAEEVSVVDLVEEDSLAVALAEIGKKFLFLLINHLGAEPKKH